MHLLGWDCLIGLDCWIFNTCTNYLQILEFWLQNLCWTQVRQTTPLLSVPCSADQTYCLQGWGQV